MYLNDTSIIFYSFFINNILTVIPIPTTIKHPHHPWQLLQTNNKQTNKQTNQQTMAPWLMESRREPYDLAGEQPCSLTAPVIRVNAPLTPPPRTARCGTSQASAEQSWPRHVAVLWAGGGFPPLKRIKHRRLQSLISR